MRILLVDDHVLFMKGMRFLLSELSDDMECVEAKSYELIEKSTTDTHFDLILLDWNLPELSGLPALQMMRERFPESPIVIISGEESPSTIRQTIEAGALGFIPKSSTSEVLTAALQLILAGGTYIPKAALMDDHVTSTIEVKKPNLLDQMSPKQFNVLLKAIQGKPNKTIARELYLSDSTVKAHLSAAFIALGVRNRTEAVYAAARLGLVPLSIDE
ncbi:response regulator [Undibacterium danionis]|uniref:Response regulator n=1 Tax=Undibacterium danionis TaxID=1812100 RepID=A0ABV6IBL3_9BURK